MTVVDFGVLSLEKRVAKSLEVVKIDLNIKSEELNTKETIAKRIQNNV